MAAALAGPRDDAIVAVGEVRGGFGGVGAVAEAFDAAWRRVAEGDEAPLPVLLAVSTDLGRLVEECGCDIEGAKLEVWIELGILVVELLALAVAAVLTVGAASPAAGAAIAATRVVVQQIFKRLMAQLARKTLRQGLKEAGERAAKQVAEGGMRGLARKAALGGLEEAAQESGVTLATQAYQNSTGRRHGLDVTDIGMSALGGAAGGAAAPLAGLGRHATGRAARIGEHFGREMGGEAIAEQAASLATGQGLVSLEDAARAAASGATGSATGQADVALHARLDARMAALAGAPLAPADLAVPPDTAVAPAPSAQGPAEAAYAGLESSGSGSPPGRDDERTPTDAVDAGVGGADQGLGSSQAVDGKPSLDHAGGGPQPLSGPTVGDGVAASSVPVDARLFESSPVLSAVDTQAAPAVTEAPRSALSSVAAGDVTQLAGRGADAGTGAAVGGTGSLAGANASVAGSAGTGTSGMGPAAGAETGAGGPSAGTASSGARTVHSSAAPPLASVPNTAAAAPISPHSTSGSAGQPVPGPRGEPVPPRFPKLEALNPNPRPATPQPSAESADSAVPLPRSPEWWAAKWAADREAFDRRRYRDYFERQRAWFEDKRRRGTAAELRATAALHLEQARWLIRQAHSLTRAGRTHAADEFILGGRERERESYRQTDLADAVLEGRVAPPVVDIDNWDDFSRINTDDPSLVVATVEAGGPSALTGDDDPPPIDRSRRYGEWGGLRPPLALHQSDLEGTMPRDAAGQFLRTADPRRGGWFRLANDGGPSADATRAINCLDCTLSLYETWVHGRPRVSAPRTFDSYAEGDITRPLGGEIGGPGRVEAVTGGRFQQLAACDPGGSPQDAWKAVNRGFRTIEDQLRAGGHGSYAFLITAYEGGGSHAWVALNQNGSVLYLDPQNGSVSDMPLYTHDGWTARHNVTDIDALILDPDGRPMPVPGAPPGQFSQFGDFVEPEPEDRSREWQPGPDDPTDDELYVNRVHLLEGPEPTGPAQAESGGGLPGSSPEPSPRLNDGQDSADGVRQPRVQARTDRLEAGVSVHDVVADSADLDQVFTAGVAPSEVAAVLDGPTLRRLVPQLDDAAARDLARLFGDSRVRQMLDATWQEPPRGEPLLAEELVKQLVANPDLARLILSTPELADSLTARPLTLHHLAAHRQAIGVLESVLRELNEHGPQLMKAHESPTPKATPLNANHRRISAMIQTGSGVVAQSGFDRNRMADPKYRGEYLDSLYEMASVAQSELVELANWIARVDGREVGAANWRREPKDRQRAEDKIAEYEGDVSRLLDLAGAKVEFSTLDDLYGALERLARHQGVSIVRYRDRFQNPQDSGYRDVQLVLRMSNGHLAEFRLHLASLDRVAVWEHALYEVRRDLDALALQERRPLTPRERAMFNGILEREQRLFWDALVAGL
ncbi:toxin glutamine deamidase domain-containing protein [Micromonospora olivasterospora]|uniref:toxin glutamine deamidase domain-containing protein n=1 Tax=Micromonospora olivasterospora TaxID=1880 RepID=UPI0031D3F3B1